MMEIKSASFVISNTDVKKCPAPDRHEYAFIGRSNVGKSSLINMLTKTQLINHFLINNEWYLVDLPGYGYARTSKSQRGQFSSMIKNYILKRENMVCLFVLIDSRHDPLKIDLDFMEWLGENGVPFVMVFTKADKLTTTERMNCIAKYQEKMKDTWESMPMAFITSAETKLGRVELLSYISELNKLKLE